MSTETSTRNGTTAESTPEKSGGVQRRQFLKVLGGGTAVATTIGCSSERVEKLIPYLVSPDQTVPGVSTYYATTCRECPASCGLIVETRDGRAIKLEGNPDHPVNQGTLCARGQSSIQGLYNPDRYRTPMVRKDGKLVATTWDEALKLFSDKVNQLGGRAANAVFINQHESGSFPAVLDNWLAGAGMPSHISYEAEVDTTAIAAHKAAYGVAWPFFDTTAATLIVSFGADFLESWGAGLPQHLAWGEARAKLADAPRLVYVSPRRSLTGLNADQWIDCKPGSEAAIAQLLAGQLSAAAAAQASGVSEEKLAKLAAEFRAAASPLLLASGSTPNGTELLKTVTETNVARGALGKTIRTDKAFFGFEGVSSSSEVRAVADLMNAGQVPMLMIRHANPVYTIGKNSKFAEGMAKVPFKVSFSSIMDDTSELCDLILPDHHYLEQWGDAEPFQGTLSLQQPTMDPVFDTKPTSEVLMAVATMSAVHTEKPTVPDYRTWLIQNLIPGGASALAASLPKGIMAGNALPRRAQTRAIPSPKVAGSIEQTQGDFYLWIYSSPTLGDGRGANKPWLQELPDPVTKICWQTVAEIHPLTARRLGIENGDLLTLPTSAGSLTLPALRYIGVRQDTIAVATGRGHVSAGRYASAGENPLGLLPVAENSNGAFSHVSTKVSIAKAGGHREIVTTEGSARQHGRGIAQAILAADLEGVSLAGEHGHSDEHGGDHGGEHAHHMPGDASHEFLPGLRAPVANDAQGVFGSQESNQKGMYADAHWSNQAKRRWAMTVDLARCTGCAACVTACYAENNIPTVGADWQVPQIMPDRTGFGANILRSREMSWLRIERYYEGGEDGSADFESRFVPMMCQHCGNAPCEPVCPVYATYHAPDGLNVQVYNRCVGTRYCSNNCPYKVRYFNWFGYGEPRRPQYAFPEPLNWQLNPDVTVRGKGVMEKCSFCVQRIRETENRAKLEDRPLHPDEFTTACAQACPSRAITFGDAADPNWSVSKIVNDRRAYHVFPELNTFTAVVYLKKVNHPEPQLAVAPAQGEVPVETAPAETAPAVVGGAK